MTTGRATIAILALLTIAIFPVSGQDPSNATHKGEHRILFRAREGVIYIPARVNGSQATLLLDTGATLTTLSLKMVPTLNADSRITMNTAKGSISAFLVSAGLTLGGSKLKEERCSFRRTVVVGDFKFGQADGVIGTDVLSSFKSVTLDFQNSVLILEDR
jgi:predicted aspartyl protease